MAELRAYEYQSLESEQAILGCCLMFPDSIPTALEFNEVEHFYQEIHQVVFRAIARLYEKGALDVSLVTSLLKKEKSLKSDPILLLADLQAAGCVPAVLERHCKLVKEQWKRRELIYKLSGHLQNAQSSDDATDHLIDHIGQEMIELQGSGIEGGPRLAKLDIDKVDEIVRKKDRGIPTGIADLDELVGGWKAGDVYIFAGRPSIGKSAYVVKLTHSLAFRLGIPTLVFTLEMSRYQYLLRTIALESKLSAFDLQHHQQTEEEMERYEAARDATKFVPLIVDGTAGISINAIRYRTRAEVRKSDIKVIVIDYLQICTYEGKDAYNREQEVARIADGMKGIAKDLGVVVIALAQVSRETERREAQRPRLSDLRECVAAGMRVLMESGQWTKIEDVWAGDRVMGWNKAARKIQSATVLSAGASGNKQCSEIRTRMGKMVRISREHRLYAESGKWVRSDALDIADRVAILFSTNVQRSCSLDIIWDEIVSIKPIGEHLTYDLSVSNINSFIVEGIVTHNSGAIEQIADVVGFIHRPEYYGTTYCEEYGNVTGKAFVFIDKNRNGPTGEIELFWNKNLACFEEYSP